MALFPKIQSPCPYIDRLSSLMDGETCRMCKHQVFDLTHMSDGERVAFMKGCSGEVCVTYKFPVRKVLATAVAIAAFGAPVAAAACDATEVVVVSGGGIKDPANVKFVENPGDSAIPQLPVVYENAGAKSTPAKSADQNPVQASISSRPAS